MMIESLDYKNCVLQVEARLKECVEKIRATGEEIHLQKGEFLADGVACWLESGKCVLSMDDSRGDVLSLFYFKPGRLVNFLPLLVKSYPLDVHILKKKVPASRFHLKALEDCKLYAIDPKWFLQEFCQDPALSCLFLHSAILNLIESYITVWNAPILSNTQRICRLLLAALDEENGNDIPDHLTQTEISRHLSIHAITVAKIFSRLRKMQLVVKDVNHLTVADRERLKALAEGREKITY